MSEPVKTNKATYRVSVEEKAAIRKAHKREGKTIKQIAIDFNLDRSTVSKIVNLKGGYGE